MSAPCTTLTELPFPQYKWCATYETYDGAADSDCPIGFGATEAEAIADLTENYDPPCPMCWTEISNDYGYCRSCGEVVL